MIKTVVIALVLLFGGCFADSLDVVKKDSVLVSFESLDQWHREKRIEYLQRISDSIANPQNYKLATKMYVDKNVGEINREIRNVKGWIYPVIENQKDLEPWTVLIILNTVSLIVLGVIVGYK
jgi:hypothetical protein